MQKSWLRQETLMSQFPIWCASSSDAGSKRGLLGVSFAVSLFSSNVGALPPCRELNLTNRYLLSAGRPRTTGLLMG